LLKWGIPSPGGRGAPKGEPESFLTTVLLAQQDQVTAIFESRIDRDPDETGKQRLTQALQALVQDPLFRAVLQRTQDKVDEAFTSKGGKKTGRHAPFPRIRERIREAEARVAELREQDDKSEAVRARLVALHDQRLVKYAELKEAQAEQREHERRWSGESARREVGERLGAAREELTRIDEIVRAVAESESKHAELESALVDHDARLAAASEGFAGAEAEKKEAEEELRRLDSETGEARRLVQRQALEKRQLELAMVEDQARRVAERARAAGEGVAEVTRLEAKLARLKANLAAEDRKHEEHFRAGGAAQIEIERLRGLALWFRYQEMTRELQKTEERAVRAGSLLKQAVEKRSQAEAIRAEIEALRLPSAEELTTLRKLREELRVVEARLEVGLSVAVRPHRPLELQFSRDGEQMQSESL
ncbi:MAG: hypothetical protein GY856_03690, partial [bacterium]|nr:hypothetical protein [bacterium]